MEGHDMRGMKVLGQHVREYTSLSENILQSSSSGEDSGSGDGVQDLLPFEDILECQEFSNLDTPKKYRDRAEIHMKSRKGYNGIIDPMEIKVNKNLRRPTAAMRLRKFETDQETKKRRKLSEHEWRSIASKRRAEKIKAEVLHILEWFFISKLADNRMRVFEAEKVKYGRQKIAEKKKIDEEEKKYRDELVKSVDHRLNKEILNQNQMKKELFEHEVFQAAETTEIQVKDKYEGDLLKLKLGELKENYQVEMNDYCAFWKKKAYDINNKFERIKLETERSLQFYEEQRILECLLKVESKWRKRASESWKGNIQLVESFLEIVLPKENELKTIQDENEKLERNIGQWEKILPHIVEQMSKFVKLTVEKDTPERKLLLNTIKNLNEFKDILPEKVDVPNEEDIGRDILDDTEILPNDDDIEETSKFQSDNDLDFKGQLLLKIKENLLDSINMVRSSSPTKRRTEYSKKSRDKRLLKRGRKRTDPKSLFKKMTEIITATDIIFEICGAKYSSPDIENPNIFVEKRQISINKILAKSKLLKKTKKN